MLILKSTFISIFPPSNLFYLQFQLSLNFVLRVISKCAGGDTCSSRRKCAVSQCACTYSPFSTIIYCEMLGCKAGSSRIQLIPIKHPRRVVVVLHNGLCETKMTTWWKPSMALEYFNLCNQSVHFFLSSLTKPRTHTDTQTNTHALTHTPVACSTSCSWSTSPEEIVWFSAPVEGYETSEWSE